MALSQVEVARPAPVPTAGSLRAEESGLPMTVLLVDDDAEMRSLMVLLLERGGCEVAEAANGQEALDILQGHTLPSIVVTDLMMPVMSGTELIRRLRSEPLTAHLPIVVVSGNANSDEGAAVSALANVVMDKLVCVENLVATVMALGTSVLSTVPEGCAA